MAGIHNAIAVMTLTMMLIIGLVPLLSAVVQAPDIRTARTAHPLSAGSTITGIEQPDAYKIGPLARC
jgi:HAMP domain-containing protein